jgi:GT2 family glycosyltransferase
MNPWRRLGLRIPADVVIPNWNGAKLLGRCLDAVAAQTVSPARVIVVDNGSDDQSEDVVAGHSGVEWLSLGSNRGFPAAANAGIATSTAPYVALLNNDALAEPGWLEALVGALDADPGVAFAASRMLFTNARGVNAAGDAFDARGRGGYNRGVHEPDGPRFDEPRVVFGASAGAALYRRSLFADVGLFDEEFFLSWEDVDLDLRAALAGQRCLYVPTAVVRHVQGASSGDGRLDLERRNKARLALKGLPTPLLLPFLALLPLREAREARAAGEGPAGWAARLRPYATEWRWAARRRGEVRRALPARDLWPLLTRESLPYDGPRA